MIRFVSTFGTDVTAGSQKLHIAAVTTTYKMAFDFDLNDINGIRWDALFYVKKGQNVDQVNFSISASSKSLFARMFDWIVLIVNDSLSTPNPRKNFIG